MKKNLYFVLFFGICFALGSIFVWFSRKSTHEVQKISIHENLDLKINTPSEQKKELEEKIHEAEIKGPETKTNNPQPITIDKEIQQEVPFVIQAPFGSWSDPDFQNACEEASVVMVMGWIRNEKTISKENAKKRILDIIAFENKTFGYSSDTDMTDLEKIFKQHLKHDNISIKRNISIDDIKSEIQKGNILIVPAFGRALRNPNFTSPGPIAHMLVIIGYDPKNKQFITNDPGTKKGAEYSYNENLLFDAIWEYPSGKNIPNQPNSRKLQKAMISVSK